MSYQKLLERKRILANPVGFEPDALPEMLFPYQKDLVAAACRSGRFGLFANTGLGKTLMESSWADQVVRKTGDRVLVLAPLAVANQSVEEAAKFGFEINLCESQDDVKAGINITNYEKIHKFSPDFAGIVLDEASIIKHHSSKSFKNLTEFAQSIPYRLAATATPSPNDYMELGCYCEFLGVMSRVEMLATFFRHDGGETAKWRLSGWGAERFWEFLLSWSAVVRKPSDLGYDDDDYDLPPLEDVHHLTEGELFAKEGELVSIVSSMSDRRSARRLSLEYRVEEIAQVVYESNEPWLIWCDYNDEADLIEKLIPDAVQIAGRHTNQQKVDRMMGFSHGDIRVLVSKPSIAGFGMNWQHCRNVAFAGLNDSWEMMRQATARCHRFGQKKTVYRHLFYSPAEQVVLSNLKRKQQQEEQLWTQVRASLKKFGLNAAMVARQSMDYTPKKEMEIPEWLLSA